MVAIPGYEYIIVNVFEYEYLYSNTIICIRIRVFVFVILICFYINTFKFNVILGYPLPSLT